MTDTQPVEVTVTYGLTQKTVEYSNARMDITIGASAPNADAARALIDVLTAQASRVVQEAVDQVLEANDLPAVYSDQPRYDILHYTYPFDVTPIYVLVPTDTRPAPVDGAVQSYTVKRRRFRLLPARDYLATKHTAHVIDCRDGNVNLAEWALATAEEAVASARAAQEAQREAEREGRQGKAIPALEQAMAALRYLSVADLERTPDAAKERADALLAQLAARVGALHAAPGDDEDDDEDAEDASPAY